MISRSKFQRRFSFAKGFASSALIHGVAVNGYIWLGGTSPQFSNRVTMLSLFASATMFFCLRKAILSRAEQPKKAVRKNAAADPSAGPG